MALEIIVFAVVWFALGAAIALWIYKDSKEKFGKVAKDWVVAGFFLCIIGALLYSYAAKQRIIRESKYPPEPAYEAPKYEFEEKKAVSPSSQEEVEKEKKPTAEKTPVRQIEGIPRCPHCGAAISAHDWNCPSCGKKLKY
ncbi:MAG: hypothetical protein QXN93_01685 [Methanomassiliicoccales archaeon]